MSFISLLIITLVTWLSLVFLSVADGIEKGWIQKLTSIHGPIKIIPTQSYYESHYNRIDLYSLSSGYHQKSLKEKKESSYLTTFDPSVDEELPLDFPLPHLDISGRPIDLLSTLHSIFHKAREKNLIIT
ncbi:MAG: ABC transporter permease, partial [Verrucomicrobia bacterium]|nr:ABC transporter permease [Verrucomicrobiota bacterium]